MTTRIVIADDHPLVRRGLMQFIADEEDMEVVAECADGESALAAVARYKPDVLIVDLQMPILNGMEVLRRLGGGPPAAVVLAGNVSDDEVVEAMRLGARGVVLKEMAPSLLVRCIRKVAAGGTWLEKEAIGRAFEKMLRNVESHQRVRQVLTPREIDIVRMVTGGLGNREIGEKLFITEGTVKTHLHSVYEKLGLKGRVQLTLYAHEHGLT
ncbi:MAG TPA: response regulator transcription factor [Thermoanaerobaculia bacterium]|jgi:DNA-binding NarL/FixJ family response regulator